MLFTPNLTLPYPGPQEGPDGAGQIYALAKRLDDLGATGTFGYAGTTTDYGNGYYSMLRKNGTSVTLLLNATPGSNGLSPANANKLIGGLPAGFRPPTPFLHRFGLSNNNVFNGGFIETVIAADGSVTVLSTSATVTNTALISGSVTFPWA